VRDSIISSALQDNTKEVVYRIKSFATSSYDWGKWKKR